jgi:hypothetical protein
MKSHIITRDEPDEYEPKGRVHFINPPVCDAISDELKECEANLLEQEEKRFAVMMNKLNAQLALDFPSEHKRGEYFKSITEYKINISKFAKFKLEDLVKQYGCFVVDIAFGWIIDDFTDETATQGISLNLSGYKYRHRDLNAELVIVNSQRKRKETLEAKKALKEEENRMELQRKKPCPELRPETSEPPDIIGGRYQLEISPEDRSAYLKWLLTVKENLSKEE